MLALIYRNLFFWCRYHLMYHESDCFGEYVLMALLIANQDGFWDVDNE